MGRPPNPKKKTVKAERPERPAKTTGFVTEVLDGAPIPIILRPKDGMQTNCLCCLGNHAYIVITKKGTYSMRCHDCNTLAFFNSVPSMLLYRAWQRLVSQPEALIQLTTAVHALAEDERYKYDKMVAEMHPDVIQTPAVFLNTPAPVRAPKAE